MKLKTKMLGKMWMAVSVTTVMTVMVRMRIRMIVIVIRVLWLVVTVTMISEALGRVCSPSLGTTNHNL